MKFQIVYFSGTGNTKLISEHIGQLLMEEGDVELLPLEAIEENPARIDPEAILGFGFPVYDLNPPKHVLAILDQLQAVQQQKAFVFSTYTLYALDSNYYVIQLLQKKGYLVTSEANFKSPAASLSLYASPKMPFTRSKKRFDKDIASKLEAFTSSIIQNMTKDTPMTCRFNKFNPYHKTASEFIFKQLYYRDLKINTNCTQCGLCVSLCPIGNLSLDTVVHIKQDNDCLKCLRCIHRCPKRAINFTRTSRKGDYVLLSLDAL